MDAKGLELYMFYIDIAHWQISCPTAFLEHLCSVGAGVNFLQQAPSAPFNLKSSLMFFHHLHASKLHSSSAHISAPLKRCLTEVSSTGWQINNKGQSGSEWMKVKGERCSPWTLAGVRQIGPSPSNQWENENTFETFEAQSEKETYFPLIVFEWCFFWKLYTAAWVMNDIISP